MLYSNMLLDGKNCLYRAIYAGLSDKQFTMINNSHCVIFFRFIATYINKFKPMNVHVFWDSDRQNTWRKLVCPEYKENRKPKCENIEEILATNLLALKNLMPKMGCRMYELPDQEADDLIYAFCKVSNRDKNLIVSSDSDFRQITYDYPNVDVFNPLNKDGVYPREERNLVEMKCFMGEKGDNVRGYDKIGPVHATELTNDLKKRFEFFKTHGKSLYLRNRKLIDLSLCPNLLTNSEYVKDKLVEETSFDLREIMKCIQIYKVRGLSTEIQRTILPFKFLRKVDSSKVITEEHHDGCSL